VVVGRTAVEIVAGMVAVAAGVAVGGRRGTDRAC
jgi:hypothetical protein